MTIFDSGEGSRISKSKIVPWIYRAVVFPVLILVALKVNLYVKSGLNVFAPIVTEAEAGNAIKVPPFRQIIILTLGL